LFSGGKDSSYATYTAVQRGWDLSHLLSVFPEDRHSMLFHVPNLHLTAMLADAMERPLVTETAMSGEEGELDALRRLFQRIDVDGVVVGAIASDYQHDRVNRVADETGLRVFAPLWRHDPRRLIRDYLAADFQIVFSSVSAEGLDASWLGRRWDAGVIEDLLRFQRVHGVHPCGEGGEFETLVLDCPLFRQRLDIVRAEPQWDGTAGIWRVFEARLVPKDGAVLSAVGSAGPSEGP
jgi:ABC transporter with metal-binding/Fe-S-binding domain ATP-binding protein